MINKFLENFPGEISIAETRISVQRQGNGGDPISSEKNCGREWGFDSGAQGQAARAAEGHVYIAMWRNT